MQSPPLVTEPLDVIAHPALASAGGTAHGYIDPDGADSGDGARGPATPELPRPFPISIMSRSFHQPPKVAFFVLWAYGQSPAPMSTRLIIDDHVGEISCPTRLALP
jgi:hypothetical protein